MSENNFTTEGNRFNCPHCKTKLITFNQDGYALDDLRPMGEEKIHQHYLLRCNGCKKVTYIQYEKELDRHGNIIKELIRVQNPYNNEFLPSYFPANVRKPYEEAIRGYNAGLLDSASGMCRKTIYKILEDRKIEGSNYKERIKNLGLDSRIITPLLNIKNIGDNSLHTDSWDVGTIGKAIEVLGVIMELIYTSGEKIKSFTEHYSQANQKRKSKIKEK